MQRSPCRACSRDILLVRSARGDSILALDPEPHTEGQYALVCDVAHLCVGLPIDRVLPAERYQNHLATCQGRK